MAPDQLGSLPSSGTVPATAYRPGGPLQRRVPRGALIMLERSAGKLARSVLRGLGEREPTWLPGDLILHGRRPVACGHEQTAACSLAIQRGACENPDSDVGE